MARITTKDLAELLENLQAQLGTLMERVERLEAAAAPSSPAAQAPSAPQREAKEVPPRAPEKVELSEEQMLAISAALAAYLGVRVRIKQIRLLSSHAWAQQGRVSIQASHNIHN